MIHKDFFDYELSEALRDLAFFKADESINYIKIHDICLSEFTKPTFNKEGRFSEGPRGFRNEYEKYVQSHLMEPSKSRNPCIYIFEVVESDTDILRTYVDFIDSQKASPNRRNCSSINLNRKKGLNKHEQSILYVGKSEKPIDGRIVVHFGYYEKGVAGLQLVYWGKDINLKINLHVFEFIDKKSQRYLEVIEKLFFVQLNPIIGKR
ncbi:MAG: hypothetical protein CMN34_04525 [Saprospirales bacterium]|nr:hypothetical protein [Saprospirales bacterium]